MPLRLRAERRAFSRDAARTFAQPNPGAGPNRTARRRHHWRGDTSALINGPHDRAWLYSGTIGASGQARINRKRDQRAEYWHTVAVRVSAEMEPHFRDTLHLLGKGARINGRHPLLSWFVVDLDVHIPGAPPHAVRAEPVYWGEVGDDGTYSVRLHAVEWFDANGARIEPGALAEAI